MIDILELLSGIAAELESVEVRCTEWPSISCQRAFKDAVSNAVSRINRSLIPRNLILLERWTIYDEHVKIIYELARIKPFRVLAGIEVHSMIAEHTSELRHAIYVVRALSAYNVNGEVKRQRKTQLSEFLP